MAGLSAPEDTITAISTPPGEGGIGIVRLSGPEAAAIAHEVFASSRGRDIRDPRAGRVFHGAIVDEDGPIDEVLVHVMRAPHSYTREDVVEINCHGGNGPLHAVLELVLTRGARLAAPGEFTKRAFLNGRIDLVQAEAVIDRIRAQTQAGLRAASAAAGGVLSTTLHALASTLADAQARIEAAVDFPEEDLPEFVDPALRGSLEEALARMRALLATARQGRLYREGARAAIAGRPNVGKSSLFNALLRDARAIVTSAPGTTRDTLEEVITIEGAPVRLTDTAGLREADGEAERIGVDRARRALEEADIVILVLDASEPPRPDEEALGAEVAKLDTPAVLALNKSDLAPGAPAPPWGAEFDAVCRVSATEGTGLDGLEQALGRLLLGSEGAVSYGQGLITRAHQQDSLRRAAEALERLLGNFEASPEFLSLDLREAQHALGEITGETTPDAVLDRIFSSFCIGK